MLAFARTVWTECLPNMVVILECLRNGREVQTLETSHFDDIMLQAPLLCFQRYYVVDIFEKAGDGIRLRAVRLWHVPEDVRSRNVVPLDCEPETHVGRVESREVALCTSLVCW
jgi:hypothetical protein